MNAPTSPMPSAKPSESGDQLLLDAAARLLESRMAAIRSGSPALHVVLELERAARAIRALSMDVNRLHEPAAEPGVRVHPALRGPPVLERVTRH